MFMLSFMVAGYVLALSCIASGADAPGAVAEADIQPCLEKIRSTVASLGSDQAQERREAYKRLGILRATVCDELLSSLKSQKGRYDYSFGGKTEQVITAIGFNRFPQAIPILADMISFELDWKSTLPQALHRAPIQFYPAAQALDRIGGDRVIEAMLAKIRTTSEDKTLKLCTWVLDRQLGRGYVAQAAVERAAQVTSFGEKAQENLLKALEFMKTQCRLEIPSEYRAFLEEADRIAQQDRKKRQAEGKDGKGVGAQEGK